MINSYRELVVWQRSAELFGLTSQMRRSAVSIPCNIAEGRLRGTKKDFLNFIRIAFASGGELETQIIIAKNLRFTDLEKFKTVDGLR